MRDDLPQLAEKVVATVIAEVPSYSDAWQGRMQRTIETMVTAAIQGFLESVTTASGDVASSTPQAVLDAAYRLGRGEARQGRSMDALAAAYRIGTRTAWTDLAAIAVSQGVPSEALAQFAALIFEYLDQLSDRSVAGHADELAEAGRERDRRRAALARLLLVPVDVERLEQIAGEADWPRPRTVTAVIIRTASARALTGEPNTLVVEGGDGPLEAWPDHAVVWLSNVGGRARGALLRELKDHDAIVGPARGWAQAYESFERALRALALDLGPGPIDTDARLAELVVGADPSSREALREKVLAPMSDLRPAAAEKLTETLRAWLFHQGRREDVAAALFIHPQTVRYRLGQLRDLYGDALLDPAFIREASIALA